MDPQPTYGLWVRGGKMLASLEVEAIGFLVICGAIVLWVLKGVIALGNVINRNQ